MGTTIAYLLLLITVALFAFHYGKKEDHALELATKVATVVSLLATLVAFMIADQREPAAGMGEPQQLVTTPAPASTLVPTLEPASTPLPEPEPTEDEEPRVNRRKDDEPVADPDEDFVPDVTFSILTGLGQGGNFTVVEGETTVFIDGNYEGQMYVNRSNPVEKLDVTVPSPGRYSYTLESVMTINSGGQLFTLNCAGLGMVNVDYGDDFEVWGSMTGNNCLLRLESS
ncbi:MAG: hypothetical protein H6668_00045 [Ardenticatenaceae bacterium]|nr:hypothetical protein [Ardenticatenaceae bacterium]